VVHAEATLHFAAETGQIMMDWIGTVFMCAMMDAFDPEPFRYDTNRTGTKYGAVLGLQARHQKVDDRGNCLTSLIKC